MRQPRTILCLLVILPTRANGSREPLNRVILLAAVLIGTEIGLRAIKHGHRYRGRVDAPAPFSRRYPLNSMAASFIIKKIDTFAIEVKRDDLVSRAQIGSAISAVLSTPPARELEVAVSQLGDE